MCRSESKPHTPNELQRALLKVFKSSNMATKGFLTPGHVSRVSLSPVIHQSPNPPTGALGGRRRCSRAGQTMRRGHTLRWRHPSRSPGWVKTNSIVQPGIHRIKCTHYTSIHITDPWNEMSWALNPIHHGIPNCGILPTQPVNAKDCKIFPVCIRCQCQFCVVSED